MGSAVIRGSKSWWGRSNLRARHRRRFVSSGASLPLISSNVEPCRGFAGPCEGREGGAACERPSDSPQDFSRPKAGHLRIKGTAPGNPAVEAPETREKDPPFMADSVKNGMGLQSSGGRHGTCFPSLYLMITYGIPARIRKSGVCPQEISREWTRVPGIWRTCEMHCPLRTPDGMTRFPEPPRVALNTRLLPSSVSSPSGQFASTEV
jgi:hypothetical protein